ncbi:MAG TPA: hypothetical protein VFD52_01955 [Clostridia bacterium]|nr:hypothetical protein [Clostridia bacterium]
MKKVIAIALVFVLSMSFLSLGVSAEEHFVGRRETIEVDTMLYPGDIIKYYYATASGAGAQIKYYGGAFDIYEEQYYGTSTEDYEYYEEFAPPLPTGFEIKDIGSLSNGLKLVDDSYVRINDVAIDYEIEHCVLEGWKVTFCEHTNMGFQLTLEAVWAEDADDPFPEPVVEEPTIIEIIIGYLKEAANFLMGILGETVAKIMEWLGVWGVIDSPIA